MKLLRNNPMGPLPNTRLRYLTDEQVKAYLQSALADGMRSGVSRVITSAQLWGQLRKRLTTKERPKRPKGLGQVGLVDRSNPRFAKSNACDGRDDE